MKTEKLKCRVFDLDVELNEPKKYVLERGERTETHDWIISYDQVIDEYIDFQCIDPSGDTRRIQITGMLLQILQYLKCALLSTF